MAAWLRRLVYWSLGGLWLTGCGWLALHFFFQSSTDFGLASHPWQPGLLMIHGVLAAAATFLFGWIAGAHIGEHWRRRLNRVSGLSLVALISLLIITGLGSYYLTSQSLRNAAVLVHEAAGVLAVAPAVAHWFWSRGTRPPAGH